MSRSIAEHAGILINFFLQLIDVYLIYLPFSLKHILSTYPKKKTEKQEEPMIEVIKGRTF